ncbi:hypothetical protein GW17_00035155, partial [Ensete ventricosum]
AGVSTRRWWAHLVPLSPSPNSCRADGLSPTFSNARVGSVSTARTSSGSTTASRGRVPNQYKNVRPKRADHSA